MSKTAMVAGAFALIQAVLEYLRMVDISEEVIEANWAETKQKVFSRPSSALPVVPKPGDEGPE